tara:strand:- start:19060 stop:20115 length:1056 start_codon:yes stop_codon:yes gene_type:complete
MARNGGINMRLLITGGCGFIGSHTVREALGSGKFQKVVNLDCLTYSGNPENLKDIDDGKYRFIHGSINDSNLVQETIREEEISHIIHLAAESHVDRSIDSVEPFIRSNIDGTRVILESIRDLEKLGHEISMVHVSTDEVYGSLGPEDPPFTEETPVCPMNPYAATKAASDMLVQSFSNTYGIKAVITRCSNNYGPNQFPEKLVPLMTLNAIEGKKLPIYGDGMQIRDWIHVSDHSRGLLESLFGLSDGSLTPGEVINFGANDERTNLEIVSEIIEMTDADKGLIEYVSDRPGHDRRYAMGFEKAKLALDWEPLIPWEKGIRGTIDWYINNPEWVESVRTGDYLNWLERHYG